MSFQVDIVVMASGAFREAYIALVPEFEGATGHRVVTIWTPTVEITRRIMDGETVDLVIVAADSVDALIAGGKLTPGSRTDIASSVIGVAMRAGAPKPDIGTTDALVRALLAAGSIAYSTGPSGVYIQELLKRLGIADALKPKMRQVKGIPVGEVVARGEAEIGFQQVCEILPVAGIDLLGPLPADIQRTTMFSAGLHVGAHQPEAAKALVRFFTSAAAAPLIREKGMAPAGG